MKNNKNVKFLIILCILTIVCFAVILIIFEKIEMNKYQKIVNYKTAKILDEIKKQYPEAEEEEIIKILNNQDKKIDKNLLKEYGIYDNDIAIKQLKNNEKEIIIGTTIIVILTGITLIFLFEIYRRNRKKQIDMLTQYVEKVSQKQYILDIDECSEDELNKLKNELYKITVMLKEEAENSKKQKEALADSVSDISHQLKTPLTSILIMLDNLSQSNNMDEITREKFINEIARQIESMNWLVISLLKLSKLDAGVIEFQNEKINIKEMIKEIISNLEIISEIKNVKIKISSNKEAYFIGDYNWNKEAIQNIVKNAIEHTKENTEIDVNIEENDVYTSISITDNGEGISNEDLKHIFDRFYKSKNSAENSFGIGLSLSKSIIEKQNGYIQVETEQGKGTTFIIKYVKV